MDFMRQPLRFFHVQAADFQTSLVQAAREPFLITSCVANQYPCCIALACNVTVCSVRTELRTKQS